MVKGKFLEGLRKLGDPRPYIKKYYDEMIDEIILLDAVASLYDRNSNYDFLKFEISEVSSDLGFIIKIDPFKQ